MKDKWVFVSGASSGIGAATARAFAAPGAKLLLGARRVERLEELARECRLDGASQVEVHPLDVADARSVNIDELLVKPVDQAAIHKVHRRSSLLP